MSDVASSAQDGSLPSWAATKALHRNTCQSVRITLRGDLLDEVSKLEDDLRRAEDLEQRETVRDPESPKIARRIRELEDEARASEVTFTFEGLGAGVFAKLQAAHPATPQIKRELGIDSLEYHPTTFPPALLAASCKAPAELRNSVTEWTEIHQTWSNGQVTRIWAACLMANSLGADTPKSERASEILQQLDSANSSITASL